MNIVALKKNETDRFVISMDRVIALLVVFLTFTSSIALNHGDSTLSNDLIRSVLAYVNLAFSLVIFGLCVVTRKIDINVAIIIPFIYLAVCFFDVYEENVFNVVSWFRLLVVFLLIPAIRVKVVKYFRLALIITALLSLFGVVLYYLNYVELYRVVEYYGHVGGEYLDFGFTYLYRLNDEIRLCGLFNEPGYLGTICALTLCYSKFDLRKIGNVVLFVAGLMTFSLAFILILFIYLTMISFKKPKLFALVLVILIFYFFVMPRLEIGGRVGKFLYRLSISNGQFAGDNRSNRLVDETLLKMLTDSPVWGYGGGYSSSAFVGVSTFKTYIIDYGVVGFILTYGSIIACMLIHYKFKVYSLAFLICFIASIYQRPGVFNVLYMTLLLGAMETHTEARWKKK